MNIRKLLTVSVITITFFITGCNSESANYKDVLDDEATYQKTMTKVQNDVNEIIGKNYKYVLENMGNPYCTKYYIDFDKTNYIDSIDELNSIDNIKLIYSKGNNGEKVKNSALYIELNKGIVSEVQTCELSNYSEENLKSSIDIIVDRYNYKSDLSLDKVKAIDLKKYIGQNLDIFTKDIDNIKPNFDIYNNEKEKNIKCYLLNEVDDSNNNMMLIYNNNNKIEDIKIVDINEDLDLLNNIAFFK